MLAGCYANYSPFESTSGKGVLGGIGHCTEVRFFSNISYTCRMLRNKAKQTLGGYGRKSSHFFLNPYELH